ncbi:hypothetical protein [Armatimonas sp.]
MGKKGEPHWRRDGTLEVVEQYGKSSDQAVVGLKKKSEYKR